MGSRTFAFAAAGLATLAVPGLARADDPAWDMQLKVESDVRFRIETKAAGSVTSEVVLPKGVERNQNQLGARFVVSWEDLKAVAEANLFLFGYQTELEGIESLSEIDEIQPYRIDVPELYVEVDDLIVDGFNLRVGQQLVTWGVADQFNPTNFLNSDDLIDPLLFGKQLGNFMVRGDFWVTDDFSLSGVLVPLFRPARLPTTARLYIAQVGRIPFIEEKLRWRLELERGAAEKFLGYPTVVDRVKIDLPDASFENMQAAFRMAGTAFEQDWALSYYYGRNDFPVAVRNHTRQTDEPRCGRAPLGGICSTGALLTDATLAYPRMHAYGLNLAGELGLGYRFEGALFVPERRKLKLTQDAINLGGFALPEGEYDYDLDGVSGDGPRPTSLDDQPFFKWTLGLDYTFPGNVYVNLMWVHGLADEFGAGDWIGGTKEVRASGIVQKRLEDVLGVMPGENKCIQLDLATASFDIDGTRCSKEILRPRIADYVVAGVDVRFLDDQLLTRLFTLLEVSGYEESLPGKNGKRERNYLPFYTPEGFSAAVFPEVSYNFGNGLELGAGALFNLGKSYTKFGDPAAGGSITFLRARYTL